MFFKGMGRFTVLPFQPRGRKSEAGKYIWVGTLDEEETLRQEYLQKLQERKGINYPTSTKKS